jgi:FG-GAP-like repeat
VLYCRFVRLARRASIALLFGLFGASAWADAPREQSGSPSARAIADLDAAGVPLGRVLRAIAVDVDRDGDLDVLVSTREEPVVVWLNDGAGHFTRQRPATAPSLTSETAFEGPVGDDVRLGPVPSSRWQAPPAEISSSRQPVPELHGIATGHDQLGRSQRPATRESRGPPAPLPSL